MRIGISELWRRLRHRLRGPRRLPPDRLTIAQAEARIRDWDYEVAYVFDLSGRQKFRQEGGEDFLLFSVSDLPSLKDAVVLHNHPPNRRYSPADPRHEGGSLSRNDLDFAVQYDLAEMRVITAGWHYVVARPTGGWPVDPDTMVALYDAAIAEVDREFRVAVDAGRMTVADMEGRRRDEAVRRVAELVGFTYRREPA